MAKTKINCYVCDDKQLGFEIAGTEDWVLFERDGKRVIVDKFGELSLNAACCRKIAAWLNRVADGRKGA